MEKAQILTDLTEVFRDVLDNPELNLALESTASDVEGWDSLTHIQLIVSIEKHYKIRFTSKEIQSWKNIDELVDSILAKLK
jgi:acyl carrier protein